MVKLESSDPDRPFQPSLTFVSKTGDYTSEASFRCSTLGQTPDIILG
jgi:hypothetical protein